MKYKRRLLMNFRYLKIGWTGTIITSEYLINGCQSKVWLHADLVNGKILFDADSDAVIVKGIVALLVKVLNKRTPEEILENDLHFIDDIGLRQNLSPTRSNGLLAMVKKMRLYALAFKAKGTGAN
jgi:cysteine desulfuration protein SufE